MNCVEFECIHELFSPEVQQDVEAMMNETGLNYFESWYGTISCGLLACFDIPESRTCGEIYEDLMNYIANHSGCDDGSDINGYYDYIYWAGVEYILDNY